MDVPCQRHGSHKLWDMPKRWIERMGTRTREAYCPEDHENADPVLFWTGSSWLPVPGRGVETAWCPDEGEEVPLGGVETETAEERKGQVTYALCPACGTRIARRNRWKYWEPLHVQRTEGNRRP